MVHIKKNLQKTKKREMVTAWPRKRDMDMIEIF